MNFEKKLAYFSPYSEEKKTKTSKNIHRRTTYFIKVFLNIKKYTSS